jgi:GT2 family glycosyltransferase
MIVRKEVLDAIGLLDEDYYTYFDDVDFCLRARRAGWPTWYVPQSRVIHLVGCSTKISTPVTQGAKRRPQYWFEARRRFFIKSYGAAYAALVDLAFMAGFAVWRFRRWVQRKPDPDPPHMLWDTFRNSVLLTGPRLRAVENPVLREWQPPCEGVSG